MSRTFALPSLTVSCALLLAACSTSDSNPDRGDDDPMATASPAPTTTPTATPEPTPPPMANDCVPYTPSNATGQINGQYVDGSQVLDSFTAPAEPGGGYAVVTIRSDNNTLFTPNFEVNGRGFSTLVTDGRGDPETFTNAFEWYDGITYTIKHRRGNGTNPSYTIDYSFIGRADCFEHNDGNRIEERLPNAKAVPLNMVLEAWLIGGNASTEVNSEKPENDIYYTTLDERSAVSFEVIDLPSNAQITLSIRDANGSNLASVTADRAVASTETVVLEPGTYYWAVTVVQLFNAGNNQDNEDLPPAHWDAPYRFRVNASAQ